jgi:nucleoside-diphosphate-sugar epimerase
MSKAAILVTGAAGLIGFTLAKRLAEASRAVIGSDVVPPDEEAGFRFVRADLSDVHRLHAIFGEGIEAVAHCGAVSGPMLGRDNPRMVVESNLVGTANVLEAARLHRARRLVYCSSTSAYGDSMKGAGTLDESAPLSPTDIYGATKAGGDILTRAYAASAGIDAVVLRFSWVYGPRRRTDCVIREMLKGAQAGRTTRLPYGGGFHRQYVYIEDVVSALVKALDAPGVSGRAFNITAGVRSSFEEIVGRVKALYPNAEIVLAPGPDPQDQVHARFEIAAAAKHLGWTPAWPFENGLAAYAKWLETHPI